MRRAYPLVLVACVALACVAGCAHTVTGHPQARFDTARVTVTGEKSIAVGTGEPVLSPDGQRVFTVTGDGACVRDVSGAHKKCAPAHTVQPDLQNARWSPDSTRIVFTDSFFEYAREPDVWVMTASTGAVKDLTDDGISKYQFSGRQPAGVRIDLLPSWSSDSSLIHFIRARANETTSTEVCSLPANGGSVRTLATIGGSIFDMKAIAFSPEGQRMAYTVGKADRSGGTVYSSRIDGSNLRVVSGKQTGQDKSTLSFSPDGADLLIDSVDRYREANSPTADLARVVAVDGGPLTPVDSGVAALFPTWSPYGHALAFVTQTVASQPAATVSVVAAPGDHPRVIWRAARAAASNAAGLTWSTRGILVYANGPVLLTLR